MGACIVRDATGRVLERWATVPVLDAHRRPVAMRFRTVPGPCLRCNGAGCPRCASGQVKKSFRNCKGRPLPLFNVSALSGNKADNIIVTEGEFDVIALWDYGFRANVVSGTGGAGTWKEEWLDALEPYAGFYLAYDDDPAGDTGVEGVAAKLGKGRCSRVRFPRKDAGDCLAERVPFAEIERALDNAQDLEGIAVVRVGSIVDELINDMNTPALLVGVPTGSSKMDACIGGDLPGLTVVTGDSSAGKTTFTTWQMYERARVGIPVLLTAFEQGVKGVVQKLLRIQVGGDFTRCTHAELVAARDALEAMPIFIVNHKGRLGYDDVVATLRKAVRRLGVKAAQVDHLGYVQDDDAQDQVRDITKIVKGFALLGPEIGCSIWLIAHPNNNATVQQRRVQMGDLRGAAAIRQEAHIVIVVHRHEVALRGFPSVTLYFDKVRSDFGMPGSSCSLAFDPMATTYADEWAQTPAGSRGSAGAGVVSPSPPSVPSAPARASRRRSE